MYSRYFVLASAAACAILLSGCREQASKTALLVIDVQDCFIGEGSLGVPAAHIIDPINSLINGDQCAPFDDVVFTQDFHPAGHISFGASHGVAPFSGDLPIVCIKPESGMTEDAACCPKIYIDPGRVDCSSQVCPPEDWNYDVNNPGMVSGNPACTECHSNPEGCYETVQAMWTDHCLQTGDSTFPTRLNMGSSPKIVQKGLNTFVDAYSGFKDNSKQVETELHSELQRSGITDLVVVGIATDVCVKESVTDALGYGYTVTVLSDATADVFDNEDNFNAALQEMRDAGATIMTVADWTQDCSPATQTSRSAMEKLSTLVF